MASLARHPATGQLSAAAAAAVLVLAAVQPEPAGWIAGLAYTVVLVHLLDLGMRRAGAASLGPAGLVTLTRATLTGGVLVLVVDGVATGTTPGWPLVALAAVALVLDAVDGQVARRTGTATPLGARFDMEADAVLLLVLSAQAALLVGPWVLAIGLMRYVFVAVSRVLPWLRGTLSPRYSAKVVAALQGIVLVVAVSEVLPTVVAAVLVAASLALLTWSFGHDVRRLRRASDVPRAEPAA